VTGSNDIPEHNSLNYPLQSFDLSDNATSTSNVQHIRTVNSLGVTSALDDHTFTDNLGDVPLSISFWIKLDSTASTQYIAAKGFVAIFAEWSIHIDSTNRITFRLNSQGSASNYIESRKTSAYTGAHSGWDYFVLTYDGSETSAGIKIYRNGSDVGTPNSLGSYSGMRNTNYAVCIGSFFLNSNYTPSESDVRGKIHSFAIWKNRALSSSEISALYNAYLNGPGGEARSGFISRSPRLMLRELDDHPGSYSTVRRSGDPTRTGALATNFDDTSTIVFSESGTPVFPSMLPKGNQFNSQAVDILGQESDISISAAIRSFQHPTHLHYSPVEEMGPFDESKTIPATDFFVKGTDPEVLPNFSSPVRSKIAIEIDITPQSETTFTRNVHDRNSSEGQPVSPDNTGFMYFNFDRQAWEQIGKYNKASNSQVYFDYDIDSAGFPGDPVTASFPSQFSISPCVAFAPDSEKQKLGYSKIGTPVSAFGAPSNSLYHASASQTIKMSDYISAPFLLEAVQVEFGEVKAQRVQGDSYVPSQIDDGYDTGYQWLYQSGTMRDIDNYVFFAYRQNRKNRELDSSTDALKSERYLVFSGSMTFWNSASFESNQIRYEGVNVNKSLTHTPTFEHEFGLPYSSSLDVRLVDWDPSHDTYYVGGFGYDLTSYAIAHFNFEQTAASGETVDDKTGNGHIATVGNSMANVIGPEAIDLEASPYGGPSAFGSIYEAGAYISNRGYLMCAPITPGDASLIIDHVSDLQMTSGNPTSIAMWIHPVDTTPSSDQYVITKAANIMGLNVEYAAILGTTGKLTWRVYGSGGGYIQKVTSNSLTINMWHHVVFAYSGATSHVGLKIFIDGVEVNTVGSNSGTFTSPLNSSYDVLVGGFIPGFSSYIGELGSLEFYSKYFSSTDARNHYLLQSLPFLNPVGVSIGSFTGSISMNLYPTVANRQIFGVSSYLSWKLQNAWIGGTAAERFTVDDWNPTFGSTANPFITEVHALLGEDLTGKMLDGSIFIPKIDSRAQRFFGMDANPEGPIETTSVSGIVTINDNSNQSTISTYLLFPEDELIFGIDAGIPAIPQLIPGYLSNLTGSHLKIGTKPCRVRLFGSLISDSKESMISLNQNLSSDSVHEVVGAEAVLDQFQIEPPSSYFGSYLDDIVAGDMARPLFGGTIFETQGQDESRRVVGKVSLGQAGTTGSFQRFVKLSDSQELIYDSCLPDYFDVINVTPTNSGFKYRGDEVLRYPVNVDQIYETGLDFESVVKQFPFEGNPKRRIQKTAALASSIEAENFDIMSDPVDFTGVTLDPLNAVFLTRYAFVSNAPGFVKPDYTAKFFPVDDPNGSAYDLSTSLVSSYFFTGSADEILYDISGNSHNLDLTPNPGDGPHPSSTDSTDVPVINLIDNGSLLFSSTTVDANVQYVAASVPVTHHMMTTAPGSGNDVPFTLSITFKASSIGAEQVLIERSFPGNATNTIEYQVFIDTAGAINFRIYESNVPIHYKGVKVKKGLFYPDLTKWTNLTVTYDGEETKSNGSGMKIYLNGNLQTNIDVSSSASGVGMYSSSSSRLLIAAGKKAGVLKVEAARAFFGRIHGCHIWKGRVLSSSESKALSRAELSGTSNGVVKHRAEFGITDFVGPLRRGTYRYGISNINQELSDLRFLPNHFGHLRDVLEQRRDTAFVRVVPPVKFSFVSGSSKVSADLTHSQNISTFATSSLPYFDDGIARNRSDNPDDMLLI
jgi:hypothetical protein